MLKTLQLVLLIGGYSMEGLRPDDKRGYLHQNFRLFHIRDQQEQNIENHYHDFDKIVIFLSGEVTYIIEGKSYYLKPWDILLVNHHDIHKVFINANMPYDRIVIWVNPSFIDTYYQKGVDLSTCFKLARERSFNLVRLNNPIRDQLHILINTLEAAIHDNNFASKLLMDSIFIQFIIYINRIVINSLSIHQPSSYSYDPKVEELILYINKNLEQDLSIPSLADKLYISKHYLMHRFKQETGFTIHNYIMQKRILLASELLREKIPATQVALQCGFKDYSTFQRAFKKIFQKTPRDYSNS